MMTTEGVLSLVCFGFFVVAVFMIGFSVGQRNLDIGGEDDDDPMAR